MIKSVVFLVLLLTNSFFISLNSQADTMALPIFQHRLSKNLIEDLSNGALDESKVASQLTYIGEYLKAQEISYDGPIAWGFDTLTREDQVYFADFSPIDAIASIIEESAKHQIVIINEAHHKPQHRMLTRSLLKGLYQNGYKYFGLEALTNLNDSIERKFSHGTTINERGYPLNSPVSGTYTSEPQMSNLIREAITIGFTIFKYEEFGKEREQNQAKNIAKILEEDPEAKILIHCGWYHLLEKANNEKRWMASYLSEYTGINPLTIYQDILVERYSSKESPFYEMIKYDSPKVFRNQFGEYYNGFKGNSYFDILVYHPRTQFVMNRPNWLYHYPGNKSYDIENITVGYPCLIKAYKSNEDSHAMPIDIIEKDYENDPTVLCLPLGEYRLEITNDSGDKEIRTIIIK